MFYLFIFYFYTINTFGDVSNHCSSNVKSGSWSKTSLEAVLAPVVLFLATRVLQKAILISWIHDAKEPIMQKPQV